MPSFDRWHRIALSVEGGNVSLSVDCEDPMTLPLNRDAHPVVSVEGITLLGARRPDEDVFEVGKLQTSHLPSLAFLLITAATPLYWEALRPQYLFYLHCLCPAFLTETHGRLHRVSQYNQHHGTSNKQQKGSGIAETSQKSEASNSVLKMHGRILHKVTSDLGSPG